MMNYCTQCGAQNEKDSVYCASCGFNLRPVEAQNDHVQAWGQPEEDQEVPVQVSRPPREPVSQRVEFVPAREARRVRPYHVYRTRHFCGSGRAGGSLVGFLFIVLGIFAVLAIFSPGFFGSFFGGIGEFGGKIGEVFGEIGGGLGETFGNLGGEMGHMGSEMGSNFGNWNFSAFPWRAFVLVFLLCSFIIPGIVIIVASRKRNHSRIIRVE